MKIIAIGSKNPTKVEAAREVFQQKSVKVCGMPVPSGVGAQPLSDEETRSGALHRAHACLGFDAEIGIGLEGGVMEGASSMLALNWGVLVDRTGIEVSASGARFPLPDQISNEIRNGKTLGEVMDKVTSRKGVHQQEGAVGILTDGRLTRKELYLHICRLLAGQYAYLKRCGK